MKPPHLISLLPILIIALGSIALFLSPFIPRRWNYSSWVKAAFWMLGPVGVAWSVLSFVRLFYVQRLSAHALFVISDLRTLLTGIALGNLALFFLSGEYRRASKQKNSSDDQKRIQPTA